MKNTNVAVYNNDKKVINKSAKTPNFGEISINAIYVKDLVFKLTGNFLDMSENELNKQLVMVYLTLAKIRKHELSTGETLVSTFANGDSISKADVCMFAMDILMTHISCVSYAIYKWQLQEARDESLALPAKKRLKLGIRRQYKDEVLSLYSKQLEEKNSLYWLEYVSNGKYIAHVDQALIADTALKVFDSTKSLYFEEYSHLTILIKLTQANSRFRELLKLSYEESDADNRFIQEINEDEEFIARNKGKSNIDYKLDNSPNWSEKGLFIVQEIINELTSVLKNRGQTISFNPDQIKQDVMKKIEFTGDPIYYFLETEGLMRNICKEALSNNSEACSIVTKDVQLHKFFTIQYTYSFIRSYLRRNRLLTQARTTSHPPWGCHEGRVNLLDLGITEDELNTLYLAATAY